MTDTATTYEVPAFDPEAPRYCIAYVLPPSTRLSTWVFRGPNQEEWVRTYVPGHVDSRITGLLGEPVTIDTVDEVIDWMMATESGATSTPALIRADVAEDMGLWDDVPIAHDGFHPSLGVKTVE